ncbi:hypothetical protein JCM11491_000040 [Sporobolomyces phaffii]
MTKESQNCQPTRRVDRLSRLPNELLDTIFDLAYPYCYPYRPPRFPLSKRLRPFQERLLYGRITLRSVDRFYSLYRTLDLDSTRGELVTEIAICSQSRPRNYPSRVSLDDLLSKLPNLVTLDFPVGSSHYEAPSGAVMSRLSGVTKVIALIQDSGPAHDLAFKMTNLASLSMLPNLNELEIREWPSFDAEDHQRSASFSFEKVERLAVVGDGADEETVLRIVNLCPNLLYLGLVSTYDEDAFFPDLLPLLPVTLRSLRLFSPCGSFAPCDSLLPRFSQLRQLELDHNCYSTGICHTLAQLPNLVGIRLWNGKVDYRNLAALVSGPSRLVELKSITLNNRDLDLDKRLFGHCTPAPSRPRFSAKKAYLPGDMTDWANPSEYLPDPVGLRTLRGVCHSNGVRLSGTMLDCLETLENFHIESNNRAVLAAAYRGDRDFDQLHHTRTEASRAGVTLPSFDLDSLDPDRLEVVEAELPEKSWFVLSLRNKEPGITDACVKRD